METITREFLDELIDYSPPGTSTSKTIGELQSDGAVAAYNMLMRNKCAYLADEVGMGKTYIALGVMCLFRYLKPDARVIVIAPKENIQEKWRKDLTNFVRNNWKIIGNKVKSLDKTPVWHPEVCPNLATFAKEALINQDRDFLLRMTSFSLAANQEESRLRLARMLAEAVPWISERKLDTSTDQAFLTSYGRALNNAVPNADLVIVDEAHNLSQGFGSNVSNRNRIMGIAFGHPASIDDSANTVVRKAKHVLLLSATPFEDDYAAIYRQLDLFGFGEQPLVMPGEEDALCVSDLRNVNLGIEQKRRVVDRIMIRRTGGITIAGELRTRNQYRREWRKGGVHEFDEPIEIEDVETRLMVALMQKKVAEILQKEEFNNSFQTGMLSSFESFQQDLTTATRQDSANDDDDGSNETGATFDNHEQQRSLSQLEREGVDTNAIQDIVKSFRGEFGKFPPHPKLDQVVTALQGVFDTGEKSLIFVRRVKTVSELEKRISQHFDSWVKERMIHALPRLSNDVERLFRDYQREHLNKLFDVESTTIAATESTYLPEVEEFATRGDLHETDTGGVASFFEWFFRGMGPQGTLSGAAFRRNRLDSPSSVYATMFCDNYAADLFGCLPSDVYSLVKDHSGLGSDEYEAELRVISHSYLRERSKQVSGYPRLYVFEGYQIAALRLIASGSADKDLKAKANTVLALRFPPELTQTTDLVPAPVGFPQAREFLQTETIFTKLREQPALREALWPEGKESLHIEFSEAFSQQERRRELFSAVCRLGRAYIDFYLLAIAQIGTFQLRERELDDQVAEQLADAFIAELKKQRDEPEQFGSFAELSSVSDVYDNLVAVNFPDINTHSIESLGRYFGTILGNQVPVGGVSGQVNKRLVSQFRMPGFPFVLVSTDVLQEGEDLHTFCKNVSHYGIAWTPSALEQRNGRVDRIGGLVQRQLDGTTEEPLEDDLIQVFYPHLRDTVELLQVRRVFRRLNDFLILAHEGLNRDIEYDPRINNNEAMLDETEDLPQRKERLKSAFEIKPVWLEGKLKADAVSSPDWEFTFSKFRSLCKQLQNYYGTEARDHFDKHVYNGTLKIKNQTREFELSLRSNIADEHTILRCDSHVRLLDLENDDNMAVLVDAVARFSDLRFCVDARATRWADSIFIREEAYFDPAATTFLDIQHMFSSVVPKANAVSQFIKKRIDG